MCKQLYLYLIVSLIVSSFCIIFRQVPSVAIKMYKCRECGKDFTKKFNLERHSKTLHQIKCKHCEDSFESKKRLSFHMIHNHPYKCLHCEKIFQKPAVLKYHLKTCKVLNNKIKKQVIQSKDSEKLCEVCGEKYSESYFRNHLKSLKHIDASLKAINSDDENRQCFVYETCFDNNLIIYQIKNKSYEEFEVSALNILNNAKHCLNKILKHELESKQTLKFRIGITGAFINDTAQEKEIDINNNRKQFFNDYQLLVESDDIEKIIDEACSDVMI